MYLVNSLIPYENIARPKQVEKIPTIENESLHKISNDNGV
jgi:hypothetical protein